MQENGVTDRHRRSMPYYWHFAKTSPLLKHNLVFFFGSLIGSFLNYLYYPILGHLLKPTNFGEVQALISIFTQSVIFISILSFVAIHVTVNVPNDQERNNILLGLERLALLAGIVFIFIALISAPFIKDFLNLTSIWPVLVLIPALFLGIPLGVRTAYLRGRKQFFKSTMAGNIGATTKLIFSTVFVIIGFKTFGAMVGLAVSQIVALIYVWGWSKNAGFTGLGIRDKGANFDVLKPELRYAISVFIVSFSVVILQTLSILAVKHYYSPHDAGLFAGVVVIANVVYFLMAPIIGVLITLVSLNQSSKLNKRRLHGSIVLMIGLGGISLAVITLFPNFVTKVLVGGKYLTYHQYLPRVGFTMFLLALANAILMYQVALRRYSYSYLGIIMLLITLILVYVNHATILSVVNDVLVGAAGLLLITASKNFLFRS